ncbi:translational GTPase TypA [Candidatus Dojkabacteria bacterium]|uniref:Large ribosomal subunit assembly factor BipA n=1 Tax=Candidatus Dojkabacteria bacterium TaxID=2099670 RepID=A0A5C7J790_9BACT|nr:MAG: translational GTPase TypA [Candidatus Dojkabacteria bacterium]
MKYLTVAIIAHVDHGKTTLVDALLKQGGAFRDNQAVETCVMDSNDQEKERGITIYAKNTAIQIGDTKVNIVDTPGHADFGSEVERVLRMVDSVLLLVDAYEGPMPQTRFVLRKSLELGLRPIVVINKIDKPTARPSWVLDQVFDLFVQLGATDEQCDFAHVYTIARDGVAKREVADESSNLQPLFDTILERVQPRANDVTKPFRMQIANLGYDSFTGRQGIGRIVDGSVKTGANVFVINNDGVKRKAKISKITTSLGLNKAEISEAFAGDIISIAGIPDIYVGETVTTDEATESLPPITIDPPTLKMQFFVNDSPFAGKEGDYVTSRHIRDRLEKELEMNVGLKVEFKDDGSFVVAGRGELHLAVLIETMRREGFELQVGAPEVIFHEENGVQVEPFEKCVINVPDESAGSVIERMGKRRGIMQDMKSERGLTNLEFLIPTRGLLGFRREFITLTRGEGILSSGFEKYAPYAGDINKREVGSMISGENGVAMTYSLWNLQERGPIFIAPQTEIYEGMIIGEHLKGSDLVVNATKNKQLTNMRASGTDEAMTLTPPRLMTLEDALDYVGDDELVEITPTKVRLRKKKLKEHERKRG